MKFHRNLALLATTSMLALSVGCNDRFNEGIEEGKKQGYTQGYDDGYKDGDKDGFARAQDYFASADYQDGFRDGKAQGLELGYSQGYGVGKNDGIKQGYNTGYTDGYRDGDKVGYNSGYKDGYNRGTDEGYDYGYTDGKKDGYDIGYTDGHKDGQVVGYDLGWDDGWDAGYDAGFEDGYYSLSVGKTKKMKGYADVLSMYHNELFDYSKIQAPVHTKHGLVANGNLLLSETDSASKDLLKRNAVVEQYLVFEMAKQVKSKFGLSDERSLKIAKASNHFRKFASKRAVTSEDANAYATEIIGADFSAIEQAYKGALKGNSSELNSLLEKAAEKNETTPEKMSEIFAKLF